MSIAIRESVTEAPVKKGNRWRVIVARPGQGSSGFYSEDLFRRDAHKIIAPGGQSFINHDDSRNPKDMIGVYPEGSFWSEEDKAVVSELEVFSHWKDFVEEVGPHCGISLYALGEADEDGNVTAINEDRLNGADLVARPGLIGSGLAEKLYESAKAQTVEKPSVTSAQEERKLEMEKDVEERFSALEALLTSLVTEKQTAQEEAAQVAADEKVVEERLGAYDAAVEAIEAAELPADAAKALRAEARKGTDVAPLIEFAKSVKDGEAQRIAEAADQGRDFGSRKVESATDLGKVFG
ncbi:capsid maturation protease [Microbacterium phage WaterT]|nr:capsid maturation protease [Microbacterium phage WaterT]QDK01422.1 capsid maturation protease [Microbacterium phage LeeroyJenkins]QOC59349.1 capsid maturation protease [Microbacterium phage Lifes]